VLPYNYLANSSGTHHYKLLQNIEAIIPVSDCVSAKKNRQEGGEMGEVPAGEGEENRVFLM
jgi:hypothetical protein